MTTVLASDWPAGVKSLAIVWSPHMSSDHTHHSAAGTSVYCLRWIIELRAYSGSASPAPLELATNRREVFALTSLLTKPSVLYDLCVNITISCLFTFT